MEEIAKQQEDKMPEFAIKTQILARKAEEKKKLEKAKEQMHFQKLTEDKGDDAVEGNTGRTYYVLLRTSASETWLTFLTETRLQDCHLLIGHCKCERGGGRFPRVFLYSGRTCLVGRDD